MNTMRKMYPSFFFRARGKLAMKAALQVLLVLALIATLPSLVSQVTTILTDADPTVMIAEMNDALTKIATESTGSEDAMIADVYAVLEGFAPRMDTWLSEKAAIYLILPLLAMLISPALMQPLLHGVLTALRGREAALAPCLQRITLGLKALGISLLSALMALGWMLPGYAAMILGMVVMLSLNESIGMLLVLAGCIAAVVMGLQASYRYMMAPYVLADAPQTGVRAAIRRSCEIMDRRKMELFGLQLSYIGWRLLLSLVQSLLLGIFGNVIAMTAYLALNLVLSIYITCGEAAFYEAYANGVDPTRALNVPAPLQQDDQELN